MSVAKVRVVLSSAVTWLTLAAFVLQSVVAEAANAGLPDGAVETVVSWGGRGAAFLLGVVAVIRRVTPVDDHGLLPDD